MDAKENLAKCCTIFQVFGLLYFSIRKLSTKSVNFSPSVFQTIQFVFISIIFSLQALLFILDMSKIYTISISVKNSLSLVVQSLTFFSIISVYAVAAAQSFLNTTKTKKIFHNFLTISKVFMDEFGNNLDYRQVKIWFFKTSSILTVIIILCQILIFVYEVNFEVDNSIERNLLGLSLTIFIIMIIQKFMFFVNLVVYNLKHLTILMKKNIQTQSLRRERKLKKLSKIYILIQESVELINQSLGYTTLNHILNISFLNITFIYDLILITVGEYGLELTAGETL